MWCPLTKLSLLRTLDATKASHLIANPKKCPLSKGSVTVTFAQICDCEQSNSYYLPKNSILCVTISPSFHVWIPVFWMSMLPLSPWQTDRVVSWRWWWPVQWATAMNLYCGITILPYYHCVLPYHITILHFYVALPSGPRPSLTMGNELLRPGADTKLRNSLLNES